MEAESGNLQQQMAGLQSQIDALSSRVSSLADVVASPTPGVDWLDEVWLHVPRGGGAGGSVMGNQGRSVPVSGSLLVTTNEDSNVRVLTRLPDDGDESFDGVVEVGVYYV